MEEEITQKKEAKDNKLVKMGSIFGIGLLFVILVIISVQNKNFPIKWIIIVGILISVIGLISFYSAELLNKFSKLKNKEDDETTLPKVVDREILLARLHESITNPNMRNHIIKYIPRTFDYGKNQIQEFFVTLKYSDDKYGKNIYVYINKHYPKDEVSIIHGNSSMSQRNTTANKISRTPEVSPGIDKITRLDPTSGVIITHTKPTLKKIEKQKKEEHEGDIN